MIWIRDASLMNVTSRSNHDSYDQVWSCTVIAIEDLSATMETQRPVKRTYGRSKNVDPPAPERVESPTEDEGPQRTGAADGTGDADAPSSPLDEAGGSPKTWHGLQKGAGADWRKLINDDETDEDDATNEPAETDDVLARARRAVMHPPASSSLPPLTSTDPLALSDTAQPTEEDETAPVEPRKRTIKAASPPSSSEDEHAATPRNRRTPVAGRRGTPDAEVALPSSQPEYQRLLDRAQEQHERRRARRKVATSDADAAGTEPEAERRGADDAEPEVGGLQTSPASPSVRAAPSRRRRRVVAASDEEDQPSPQRTPTTRQPPRARVGGDGEESSESDGTGGFRKTMGRIFERAKRPEPAQEEVAEAPASPEAGVRKTRRRKAAVPSDSEDSEGAHAAKGKPSLRVSFSSFPKYRVIWLIGFIAR